MPTRKSPRKGSLQFWPRKRAAKILPSVNWDAINSDKKLKGFICYKAGMATAVVVDNTPDSMTKGKRVAMPVTILECPKMKIFSVRFYKNGKVLTEILNRGLDKELKRKVKVPKEVKKTIDSVKDFDDVRVIVYSKVSKTNVKKKPDLTELGLSGSAEEKLAFIKENLEKEISVEDVFVKGDLVDTRGVTKGKGLQGPVKRFGITLKVKKSEKGQRRPGSLGPWHPARVTFRTPQAGQVGMFTRTHYNQKVFDLGKVEGNEFFKGFKNYGDLKTDFIVLKGSVQGPAKRQIILSTCLRPTKKRLKRNVEIVELKK